MWCKNKQPVEERWSGSSWLRHRGIASTAPSADKIRQRLRGLLPQVNRLVSSTIQWDAFHQPELIERPELNEWLTQLRLTAISHKRGTFMIAVKYVPPQRCSLLASSWRCSLVYTTPLIMFLVGTTRA